MSTKNKVLAAALMLTSIIPAFGMGHLKRLGTVMRPMALPIRQASARMSNAPMSRQPLRFMSNKAATVNSGVPQQDLEKHTITVLEELTKVIKPVVRDASRKGWRNGFLTGAFCIIGASWLEKKFLRVASTGKLKDKNLCGIDHSE